MSTPDIIAIRARVTDTSLGRWSLEDNRGWDVRIIDPDPRETVVNYLVMDAYRGDAVFVAHAREDVTALADEVEQLRAGETERRALIAEDARRSARVVELEAQVASWRKAHDDLSVTVRDLGQRLATALRARE